MQTNNIKENSIEWDRLVIGMLKHFRRSTTYRYVYLKLKTIIQSIIIQLMLLFMVIFLVSIFIKEYEYDYNIEVLNINVDSLMVYDKYYKLPTGKDIEQYVSLTCYYRVVYSPMANSVEAREIWYLKDSDISKCNMDNAKSEIIEFIDSKSDSDTIPIKEIDYSSMDVNTLKGALALYVLIVLMIISILLRIFLSDLIMWRYRLTAVSELRKYISRDDCLVVKGDYK